MKMANDTDPSFLRYASQALIRHFLPKWKFRDLGSRVGKSMKERVQKVQSGLLLNKHSGFQGSGTFFFQSKVDSFLQTSFIC